MTKRDTTRLMTVASELDALARTLESKMQAIGTYTDNKVTMVVDASSKVGLTLFPAGITDIDQSITLWVDGKHIQTPAYASLAFRMAMIRLNVSDASQRPPAFADMLPEVIGELSFLQDFILMTFSDAHTLAASVEYESGGTGLIKTLLLTTEKTRNIYRTQVQGCSMALRSDHHYFDLLDSARNGSVMAMVSE